MGKILKVPKSEILVVAGDFNGHNGKDTDGFENIYEGKGYGHRNPDSTRILDMRTATNLVINNAYFSKPDSKLITHKSGTSLSQIDFILIKRKDLKMIRNTKVIGNEECVSQHKLLVCDMKILNK